MTDLTKTIEPKSDQLNSDDLIGGRTLTIKITKVSLCGEPEQPIAISFEGDHGKPYKPGKSMRRVLVNVWGPDGNVYIGRSLTLYRDDKVMFGGVQVGGLRISHMSDIKAPVTMALTASKTNRKPFTVQPLKVSQQRPVTPVQAAPEPAQHAAEPTSLADLDAPIPDTPDDLGSLHDWADAQEHEIDTASDGAKMVREFNARMKVSAEWDALKVQDPERAKQLRDKVSARAAELREEA